MAKKFVSLTPADFAFSAAYTESFQELLADLRITFPKTIEKGHKPNGVLVIPDDLEKAAMVGAAAYLEARIPRKIRRKGVRPIGQPIFDPFMAEDLLKWLGFKGVEEFGPRVLQELKNPLLFFFSRIRNVKDLEEAIKSAGNFFAPLTTPIYDDETETLAAGVYSAFLAIAATLILLARPQTSGPRRRRVSYARPA